VRTSARWLFLICCLWGGLLARAAVAGTKGPVVLAAASLLEGLTDAADAWAARGHERPVISFAASPALARQIEADAPADLFISPDESWMDHVAAKGLIAPRTRVSLLGNRLVLVAPVSSRLRLAISPHFALARALGGGLLAMADPDTVPAGRYGKEALEKLGVWATVSNSVARAENVRAALVLVERREAPLGIVYSTDARASARVRVVGTFPADSHPPISYPIARIARSTNPEAEAFRRFLISETGKTIFRRRGFTAR